MSCMSRYYGLIQESKEFFRRSDKATRMSIRKFARICKRCRSDRDIVRLWNTVDHFSDPEPYWDIMRIAFPAAFKG